MSASDELATAIESGDVKSVKRLLERNPDLAGAPGWVPPPLHCAVLWNQREVASLLLDHGADIELRDSDRDTTPLRYAIMYAKPELIRLLIERGANTSAIRDGGTNARELAVEAANGAYDSFDDLPPVTAYREVIDLLDSLVDGQE